MRKIANDDMLHSFKNKTFTFFDLETNGLEPQSAIFEIGAVQATFEEIEHKSESMRSFQSVLYFKGEMNHFAHAVHKIDSDELLLGTDAAVALTSFCSFAENTVLVGHNSSRFDLPILSYHLENHGLSLSAQGTLDTRLLARKHLNLPSYKLSALAEFFDIPYTNAHRALGDARITASLFYKLLAYL